MPASRIQTSWHCAAIVRAVISSCRIRNIVSSSRSGSVSFDDITSCSSPGSFCETSLIAARCRRATADVTAYDSSVGVFGWKRPLSRRPRTPRGLDERHGYVEHGVDRAVHGDQVLVADDLVELEQVHVAGAAEVGRLRRDEDVVVVAVDGRARSCVGGSPRSPSGGNRGPSAPPRPRRPRWGCRSRRTRRRGRTAPTTSSASRTCTPSPSMNRTSTVSAWRQAVAGP